MPINREIAVIVGRLLGAKKVFDFNSPSQKSLDRLLNGTRLGAFYEELVGNSGHFLLFNALSEISLMGWKDYLFDPPHYIIAIAMLTQAWYLSRPKHHRFWGNLIGPSIYTVVDSFIDGKEFFYEFNHWVLWSFGLAIATLQGLRCHCKPRCEKVIIPLESLTRVWMFISLYIGLTFKANNLSVSWQTLLDWGGYPYHQFLLEGAVVFGVFLGLQTLQVTVSHRKLQNTAKLLRNFAEWGMGSFAVTEAVTNPEGLKLQWCDRTIVFMDIRGFTSWCEKTDPDTVAKILNQYYQSVEPAAAAYHPLRITLTADEIMAIYTHPQMGIEAAKSMQKIAAPLLASYGLGAGCAVHCGSVIQGLFGSEDVRTYTVIGDAVNTAKRLEGATPAGCITLSDEVYRALYSRLPVEPCEPVKAKGKREPLTVWRLVCDR
ncbi:MAG: adenylate/guanylate cyclase domain-containing protein [Limnospira sp.]